MENAKVISFLDVFQRIEKPPKLIQKQKNKKIDIIYYNPIFRDIKCKQQYTMLV